MSHPVKKACDKAARQLSAAADDGASIAGAIVEVDGHKAFGFSMAATTTQDIMMMAVALLRSIEESTAQSALSCAGCASDHARVMGALAALRGDQAMKPRHLH